MIGVARYLILVVEDCTRLIKGADILSKKYLFVCEKPKSVINKFELPKNLKVLRLRTMVATSS
jgi:hypothetical protein